MGTLDTVHIDALLVYALRVDTLHIDCATTRPTPVFLLSLLVEHRQCLMGRIAAVHLPSVDITLHIEDKTMLGVAAHRHRLIFQSHLVMMLLAIRV